MIKAFADEGVPPLLCAALVRRGSKVIGFPKEWKGMDDQTMLQRAVREGIWTILTRDRRIAFQSNLVRLPLGIVVLPGVRAKDLLPMADLILRHCIEVKPGEVIFVYPAPSDFGTTQKTE